VDRADAEGDPNLRMSVERLFLGALSPNLGTPCCQSAVEVQRGLDPWIEVDGGQDGANAWRAVAAGADAIVAGTAIFGAADYAEAIRRLRSAEPPVA